jgi:NTP pyrophosphatase (non-canonical NTP hydrolase)
MDIKELSQAMQDFVTTKGWYAADSPKPQTPRNIAISLNLEAAEVLEHFQWMERSPDTAALASELADVTLYLLQLARICEIDLEQAVLAKLNENYRRTWPDNRVK